jgi:hypothetical protein
MLTVFFFWILKDLSSLIFRSRDDFLACPMYKGLTEQLIAGKVLEVCEASVAFKTSRRAQTTTRFT